MIFLSIISLLIGMLGSIASIVYVINRLFYSPKLNLNLKISEKENHFTIKVFSPKNGVQVTETLLYYDPSIIELNFKDFQKNRISHVFNPPKEGPSLIAIRIKNTLGYIQKNGGTQIWGDYIFKEKKYTSSKLILVARAKVPDYTLPFLVDMFSTKEKTFKITKEISKI